MQNNRIIQVEDKVPPRLLVPLSIQHMFAMFGASVLVPFIFKMNPAIVLFMNGIGTLLFILITKGKAPAYLGSSFAFIAPATIVIQNWGYQYALGGFVAVGACGCILALIIYKCGTDWSSVVLPPAAMGPVVALIGLELAGSAASTGCIVGEGDGGSGGNCRCGGGSGDDETPAVHLHDSVPFLEVRLGATRRACASPLVGNNLLG